MGHKGWLLATLCSILMITWQNSPAEAQAYSQGGALDHLRFVDIRDLLKYNTDLSGTSNLLMKTLEQNPSLFLGDNSSHIRFYRSGAQGPRGSKVSKSGKTIFIYSPENDGSETRRNTILGAEFERIVVEDIHRGLEAAQVFSFQMILFIHDDNRAEGRSADDYYFRRLEVKVDWTIPPERAHERVRILNVLEEIPLSRTQFQVAGDLLERKVILEDPYNKITKVFPIGVGGFDVRTAYGMDNHVSLMTYEFEDAVLKKTDSEQGFHPNTRSRIYPSYYKGRPFIALYDRVKGYRQIGMHYQIDSSLTRGFVSHGCIRVEDMYLYQLDAIVNEGVHEEIPVKMVYNLQGYEEFTHPKPKMDSSYKIVNYSSLRPPYGDKWTKVECKNSSYNVRYYGETYHTIADSDCLTQLATRNGSVYDIIDYMTGRTYTPPVAYTSMDNHVPVSLQSGEGGEIEAGNQNSDNFESLEQFKSRTGHYNILENIGFGRRRPVDKTSEYLRRYCVGKDLRTSPNCREATMERINRSGSGGLY